MIPGEMPIIKRSSQSACVDRPLRRSARRIFFRRSRPSGGIRLGDGVDGQATLYDISFQLVIFDEKNRSCSAR